MKKIPILALSLLSLGVFGGIVYVLLQKEEKAPVVQTLSEVQEVLSTGEAESLKKEVQLSDEKQKQLDQIGEIYAHYEDIHTLQVSDTLKKYKSDVSQTQSQALSTLLEKGGSPEVLQEEIKETLGIFLLESDIQNLLRSQDKLAEEKQLAQTRLKLFEEKNQTDIQKNTQTLIELSIQNTLDQITDLPEATIIKIVQNISAASFQKNNILDTTRYTTFESQESLLKESISLALTQNTALTLPEKQKLITQILQEISQLEVLFPPSASQASDTTSFLPSLQKAFAQFSALLSLIYEKTYAEEAILPPAERAILILKTQILIEKNIQKSIETEIAYNQGTLTTIQYNSIINQNLTELEELLILKESLENDAISISLDDIQRFNLGGYIDDSVAIQNLPGLAYIQEKTGHIIIHNLSGSAKLGEENMLLYAGYGIETLGNASTTIVFSDESTLQLEPYSRVNITTPSVSNITVEVEKGNIWTRVLKPLLSGDTFTIDMGSISLGVRGTSLSLSKTSTGASVHIVDSYTSDGSPSVTLVDKSSGSQSSVAKGRKIQVSSGGDVKTSPVSKTVLLTQNPQIAEYLRDDLRYLSLLLDDRNRGFYNTPISSKNDSTDFVKKIEGELENTLPTLTEKSFIISNTELASQIVHSGSIYHLIQKDELITQIKANPVGNTGAKVQAVRDLDMQEVETTLGNTRALETLFDYNITQDIISRNSFTTSELRDIFLDFPVAEAQNDARLLAEAKEKLTINGGSNIVTKDVSLPASFLGVTVTWRSSFSSILSDTGKLTPPQAPSDVILTATLSLGSLSTTKDFALLVTKKELSKMEELIVAGGKLDTYINKDSFKIFTDDVVTYSGSTLIPKDLFGTDGSIIPNILWTGSLLINADGTTRRPSFNESLTADYKLTNVQAILTHPADTSVSLTKPYSDLKITKKACDGTSQIISGLCYELVASAEYNKPGDFKLMKTAGGEIIGEAKNVNLSTCGSDKNGNCAWTGSTISQIKSIIGGLYKYNISEIGDFDTVTSWLTYAGEKGIVVDNVQDLTKPPAEQGVDSLTYNISSLDLGTDWAIEMSVRGEDLKRDPGINNAYTIFGVPGVDNGFRFWFGNNYYSYQQGLSTAVYNTISSIGLSNTGYQKVLLHKSVFGGLPTTLNTVYIGSRASKDRQWNGIINYLRIYKKKP